MKPYKCPICNGHGNVPGGFYLAADGVETYTSSATTEPCRACNGIGIIWGETEEQDETDCN